MRLLVRCHSCKRHYDASGRQPGSRFRCYCGSVVEVQMVDGHDAAVVRCSGCGAPRQAGASECVHCGAAFTDAERDRNTICPDCMTRVADQARFCHSCGSELGGESVELGESELHCPACEDDPKLVHRGLTHEDGEQTPVLECPACAGLWLDHAALERLARRASESASPIAGVSPSAQARSKPRPPSQQTGRMYRPCPHCQAMMNRRNYGKRSGVIVDSCREHGIWFDADELPAIIDWIRAGGLDRARELEAQLAEERLRSARSRSYGQSAAPSLSGGSYGRGYGHYDDDDDFDLIGGALSMLARLFR